jgi:hypothetical protein
MDYTNPAQLAFTRAAPKWAEQLLWLEVGTPQRDGPSVNLP